MCKVFGVAGVTDKNRDNVLKLMHDITPKMSTYEKDGVGYAAITDDGKLFGEKWLIPQHAWRKQFDVPKAETPKEIIPNLDKPLLAFFQDVIDYKPVFVKEESRHSLYDKFGTTETSKAVAYILHTRMATQGNKTIKNVHPFIKEHTALIHNGIVYNDHEFIKTGISDDCDSEVLLNQYLDHLVDQDSRNLTEALKGVEAYLACIVLGNTITEDESVVPMMDVFKVGARLVVCYIHDLQVFVFTTEKKDIVDVCEANNWTRSRCFEVDDNVLIRINAVNGEVLEKEPFEFEEFSHWSTTGNSFSTVYDHHSYEGYMKSKFGESWEGKEIPSHREDNIIDATRMFDGNGIPDNEIMEIINHEAKNIKR